LGLGNPECKLQVSKNWRSHVLKIMSKKFPGLGLGNPHCVRPKTEISRPENHVLRNSMSRFWWTPPVQANSRWPKTETVKNALFSVFKWVIYGEWAVTGRIFQALPTQTDIVALIYKIGFYNLLYWSTITNFKMGFLYYLLPIKHYTLFSFNIFLVCLLQLDLILSYMSNHDFLGVTPWTRVFFQFHDVYELAILHMKKIG
jgi:hypothetical protein